MARTLLAIVVTLVLMHLGAFVAYGTAAALFGLAPPEEVSPGQMFAAVFVQKLGVAVAFVLLYRAARASWAGRWPSYALIWLAAFAVIECGQAIGPGYSWAEAAAGIVAEALYFPLSALAIARILRGGPHR